MKINVIISGAKIREEQRKTREKAMAAARNNELLKGLFFDGKKDNSLTEIEVKSQFEKKNPESAISTESDIHDSVCALPSAR